MKNTKIFLYAFGLFLVTGLFMACEPDPVNIENPFINLVQESGFIYKDTTLEKGQVFKVKVNATPGTYNLKLIGINENDAPIALDRIISGLDANPSLTLGADATGFQKEIEIQAQTEGISKYTFYVEDEQGYTNATDVAVTDVYTSLDNEQGGLKVYNFSGTNFGSLDLHVPAVVSSSAPEGDLQDAGININLPAVSNWIQKVSPKNGCELYVKAEGLVYEDIDTKEKLKVAVEAGTKVIISAVLKIGDVYLAKTPSLLGDTFDYFLLRVDNIVITADNNQDYYEFTLKQALNM